MEINADHWDDPEEWDGEGDEKGGSGWGTHVHSWLFHVNVWQKRLQHCKVISLQLKFINKKIKLILVSRSSHIKKNKSYIKSYLDPAEGNFPSLIIQTISDNRF